MEQCLQIVKILNNNAVVCNNSIDNEEIIVMGKGIAFSKKVGSLIDNALIDKTFYLRNSDTSNHFQKIIQEIPAEQILLAEKIISNAKDMSNKLFHDSIYISLTDHISAAIKRITCNNIIKNPLLLSVKRLYPEEYQIAKDALNIIKEETGITFPEDEAGFITMHFINAELGENNKGINKVVYTAEKIANIVYGYILDDIDEESLYWQRFVTHITFLVQRITQGKFNEENLSNVDDTLFEIMKKQYPNSLNCAVEIKNFLESQFKCIIGTEELSYLMIHISKLQNEYGISNPEDK